MREYTTSSRRIYDGRILSLEVRDIRREDGLTSMREVVLHGGAVGVLAREGSDGPFLLVRQFRAGIGTYAIEVCAGVHDPGEASETAARRELLEETGRTATRLAPLGRLWSSPGWTTEFIDVFYAECAPDPVATDFDSDEHVEVVAWTSEELESAIRDGRISDAKTVAAWALYRLGPGAPGGAEGGN